MPPDDLHRPVRQVSKFVLHEVQGREELTMIPRKLLSKSGPQRVPLFSYRLHGLDDQPRVIRIRTIEL